MKTQQIKSANELRIYFAEKRKANADNTNQIVLLIFAGIVLTSIIISYLFV